MGMAASQARFLSLTARKTNVEWEGQQVNQQRTALANESANLYNQLTAIKVPTPPAVSDYTTVKYTFTTNELDNKTTKTSTVYTLDNIYNNAGVNYAALTYTAYEWQTGVSSAYNGTIATSTDEKGNTTYSVSLPDGSNYPATKYEYNPSNTTFAVGLNGDGECTINNKTFKLNGDRIEHKDSSGVVDYSYAVKSLGDGKYQVSVKLETVNQDKTTEVTFDNNQCVIDGVTYTLSSDKKTVTSEDGKTTYSVEDLGNGKYRIKLGTEKKYQANIAGTKYNVNHDSSTNVYTLDGKVTVDDVKTSADIAGDYLDNSGNSYSSIKMFDSSYTTVGIKQNQPILVYTLTDSQDDKTAKYTNYLISASQFAGGSFASSAYVHEVGVAKKADYPCRYSTSENGRYKTITIIDDKGESHQFDLAVSNEQDEYAYKQAMLDYEYEQAKYEKKIKDINAKTEKIQQEDRTLELRLKQLDTEQNALSTEMDAVKKVIEDNVEATFKTFA